jgi:hypothetical protein
MPTEEQNPAFLVNHETRRTPEQPLMTATAPTEYIPAPVSPLEDYVRSVRRVVVSSVVTVISRTAEGVHKVSHR